MKHLKIFLLLTCWQLFAIASFAQYDPKSICKLEDGNLIFRIDQHWTDAQKLEVSHLFDLDSILLVKIFEGFPLVNVDSVTWKVKVLKPGVVEISKLLVPPVPDVHIPNVQVSPIPKMDLHDLMIDEKSEWGSSSNDITEVTYGVNSFSVRNAFSYQKETACFYLPGYSLVKSVYLSGSFNNWSTMQSPMQKVDSGWIISLKLQPGRYSYKYIIDGKWTPDPDNKLKEDDTYGSHNSIVFCYNHLFRLKGYIEAKVVILSGSFNNWHEKELKMNRTPEGWELPVFLKEGTHAYKFKVDKQWILDPANPVVHPDGNGNENSFMAIGDTVIFRLDGFTSAQKVSLAGGFNAWNSGELFMKKDSLGWQVPYVLAKGNYEYKFIVDGKWIIDPANPFSIGSGEVENSYFTYKPNHIFELDSFPDAHQVIITGSFNNWSPENFRMTKKDGKWVFPIRLKMGKYTYKFIVDGTWILDPKNAIWEENEYGTHNSVLWIEP
jgi:hypothetical protein